jgi:hypothetical protein
MTGTDGAFARITIVANPAHDTSMVDVQTFPGAELRVNRPKTDPALYARRAAWPSYLALAAFVLALDHGNVGCAAVVAIWWLGWAIGR